MSSKKPKDNRMDRLDAILSRIPPQRVVVLVRDALEEVGIYLDLPEGIDDFA